MSAGTSAVCDLNEAISFRGFALNTVTRTPGVGTGTGMSGCQVDTFDAGEVELRQFREPLAKVDGIDVGGVWLGGRRIHITGTMYGVSRAACFAALASLEAVLLPESGANNFGFYSLAWSSSSAMVMPQGMRMVFDRNSSGGDANDALAQQWACTFYAKTP